MHPNSRMIFEKYAKTYFDRTSVVLEIGPNAHPSAYQSTLDFKSQQWDTLDIFEDNRLTYPKSDPYVFPIADNRYDIVLACNVLEHVPRVWDWIKELSRVCKPGGIVITINPLSWPYHAAPCDCWRVYPDGMKALYEIANLDVIHCSYESLEQRWYRRTTPGPTFEHYLANRSWLSRNIYRCLARLGFPAMVAYDTITIGKKSA
jgi:SAM-dependent methyltransferase